MVRPDRYPQVFISFLSNLHSNLSVSNVIPTFYCLESSIAV